MELMPMWCPPTPPTSDNDVYIDYSLGFLYDNTPMSEAQLPPVYIKKEPKRARIDSGSMDRDGHRPAKIRHREESVYAPRSLFRSAQASNKMRREVKSHKSRPMVRSPVNTPGVKQSQMGKSATEQEPLLEWMIHEDWALLQATQIYQSMSLSSNNHSPGHTPNWDLVADIVNNTSRIYRSPKQCKARYDQFASEGDKSKLIYDNTPKKQKKQKGVYKMPHVTEQSKTNQSMRTCQLYSQDKNHSFTAMCTKRFDAIKAVQNKRSPTVKSLLVNPTLKNPKHAAVLKECGLEYDNPLAPLDLAVRKAERLLKEKSTKGAGPSGMTADQQQARIAQQQQQQILAQQTQQALTNAQAQQLSQAITTVAVTATGSGVSTMKTASVTANSPTIVSTNVKARAVSALGMQDVRPGTTIVTNLHTAQRLAGANLVATSQSAAAIGQKNIIGYTLANKNQLQPHQIHLLRQQQNLRQQVKLHGQAATGQKVAVAVSAAAATSSGQQRGTTLIKQAGTAGSALGQQLPGKHNITTRNLTESEIAAIMVKRQQQQAQQQQQNKTVTQVQMPAQAGISGTQVYTQTGLQVQAGTVGTATPVATLVKTAAGTVRTAIPQQQMRQIHLQTQLLAQRKISGQKIAQLAQVAGKGMPTQLIVPGKAGTMTVQQLQQVMKSGATVQQFVSTGQPAVQTSQVVFAKSPLPPRVIPVSSGTFKQTIQVVASNPQLRQAVPTPGKPIVTTARASPGPSQVRYTVTHQQAHAQQQSSQHQQLQQQQQQTSQHQQQQQQSQQQQTQSTPPDLEPK